MDGRRGAREAVSKGVWVGVPGRGGENVNRVDYHQYMASREWRIKRREALASSGGVCQRCWGAPADQVHHITYARLGNERPEDLMAICRADHEYLSAVSDVDPVRLIPQVKADPVFWKAFDMIPSYRDFTAETFRREPTVENEYTATIGQWLHIQIHTWINESLKRFQSLPERKISVLSSSRLMERMVEEHVAAADISVSVLDSMGLDLAVDRRWSIPMSWEPAA
jgi:hypothetical protein